MEHKDGYFGRGINRLFRDSPATDEKRETS